MSYLVIVESPSKATTIKGYLGSNYKVIASKGHVRDLPKSSLGVDIENGFDPHYINIRGKGDLIKEIRKEAKAASKVFLATDPDREGEAISWHLAAVLGIPVEKTRRVIFNEITKNTVKAAIKEPRTIDMSLVDAQQARRILDRIVGYKVSPILWKNVKSGLSAGRVQSVATKIIVDRENEIRAFTSEEYWTIDAELSKDGDKFFTVRFFGDENGKIRLASEEQTMNVVRAVEAGDFKVRSVKRSTKHKSPAPPFTTSTMLQEASKKLGFQSQRIMRVAQELYEGVNLGSENGGVQGLITYMRTDSLRISAEAQELAKEYIVSKYGDKYYPEKARVYKSKALSQDAHEAIRPARADLEPAKIRKMLTSDQYKLYKLIWDRFIASQMESAEMATLTVDFENSGYIFRASGYNVTFPGYMALYEEAGDEVKTEADEPGEVANIKIPDLKKGESLAKGAISPDKHFTEAPPRYSERSLIKCLEDMGIGRPSTYTPIITTIVARNYVKRDGGSLVPTPLGEVTTALMVENFKDIVDYKFTADMEKKLDAIGKGTKSINSLLNDFWKDFSVELEKAEKNIGSQSIEVPAEETDIICDKCGSRMVVKNGRFGKFAACPNYPKCKNTKPLTPQDKPAEENKTEENTQKKAVIADFKCEKCGSDMVLRSGPFGSFYACSKYPTCKFTKAKTKELGVPCPVCNSKIITKYGRNKVAFYSCEKYPECNFSTWDMPTNERCPECNSLLFKKKGKALLVCSSKDCKFSKEYVSEDKKENDNE